MTMRLAIISDTHLASPNAWFEEVYARHLAPADLLFHCGDSTGVGIWSYLLQHPRFEAVAGNSDSYDLASSLPALLERTIASRRVAVVHGWGARPGLSQRLAEALGDRADIVFFGHSHAFEDSVHGRTRLINPGSLRPGGSLALVAMTESDVTVERVDV